MTLLILLLQNKRLKGLLLCTTTADSMYGKGRNVSYQGMICVRRTHGLMTAQHGTASSTD